MALEKDQIKRELLDSGTIPNSDTAEPDVVFLVENELVEEYLEGSMPAEDKSLFERNFLITEDRREMYNEIRLLKQYSSGPHRFNLEEISHDEPARSKFSPIITIVGIAILAAGLLLIWFFFNR